MFWQEIRENHFTLIQDGYKLVSGKTENGCPSIIRKEAYVV